MVTSSLDRHPCLRGWQRHQRPDRGSVLIELVVAMGILTSVMLPIAFSYTLELRTVRAQYFRAVAMEIVDGEMEILLAGEWQTLASGQHRYPVHAPAATNLPPGQFTVSFDGQAIQLEWRAVKAGHGGAVSRSAQIPRHSTSL